MTTPRTLALLSLSSLLVAGCSSGPAPVAVEDIPRELGGAFCAQFEECATARGLGGEISFLLLSPSFAELCPSLLGRQFGALGYLSDAVDSGRVLYDGVAARRCLDEILSSCTLQIGFDLFPACREAFRGTVPLGESCTLSEECVAGSRCDAQLVGDVCDGECVALLAPGTPCSDDDECESPAGVMGIGQCDDNGGPDEVCVTQRVEAGLGEGEVCGSVDETGVERRFAACAGAFFCDDPDGDGEGTCRVPLGEGELCEGGRACELGSICFPVEMNLRCTAITVATEVGDACNEVDTLCDYTARLECDAGSCVALAPGSCREVFHCESNEYCDDATDTCEPLKALGEVCDDSQECESNSCEDDGTMTATQRCSERVRCG